MTNASIILQGRPLDVVGSHARGVMAGEQVNQARHSRDYRNALMDFGAAAYSGDQSARNRLAMFDPSAMQALDAGDLSQQAARLGMDQTRLNMQATTQRMRILDEQNARQIEAAAAQRTAAENAAERDQLGRIVASAMNADPEQWDAIMRSDPDTQQYVGQHGNREQVLAGFLDIGDILDRQAQGGAEMQGSSFNPDQYRVVDGRLVDLAAPGGPVAVDLGQDSAPARDFSGESDLRGEWNGLAPVKAFSEQAQAYGRIAASAINPSPAGDLALIFNYMKVLDPGSVVRESEFATAAQASAWLQQSEEAGMTVPRPIAAAIRSMATGERLSDRQRQDFVDRATSLYRQAEDQYSDLSDQYRIIAEDANLSPDAAIVDYRFREQGALAASPRNRPQVRPGTEVSAQPTDQATAPAVPPSMGNMTQEQWQNIWDAMPPEDRALFQ